MEKLKELQEKLKSRPAFQLDVMDCVTEKEFQKAVNQSYLDKNHGGSLAAYINSLAAKGLKKIQLNQRLKNGSSSKPGGPSVTVDLLPAGNTAQNNVASATPQMAMPAGLNGAFGLGMPEILDGFAAKRELESTKLHLAEFKKLYEDEREKRKKLSDKIQELTRENDQYSWEKNTEKEPSKFDKIIDGVFANPEKTIPALLAAFTQLKGGSGLNAPQEAQIIDPLEGYTEMQRGLCEMVGQMKLPDALCDDLASIIARVYEPDRAFAKELKKLLETPSLKAVQNG